MSKSHSFKEGDRVIYVPNHAFGDRRHPDCEHGRISTINAFGTIFVRFDKSVAKFGWDGATGQSCYVETLVKEEV
jgi:hypothetical protein